MGFWMGEAGLKLIFFFWDLPLAGADKRPSWAHFQVAFPFLSYFITFFLLPSKQLDFQPCVYRGNQIRSLRPAVLFYFVWGKASPTSKHGSHGKFASDFNHTACNDYSNSAKANFILVAPSNKNHGIESGHVLDKSVSVKKRLHSNPLCVQENKNATQGSICDELLFWWYHQRTLVGWIAWCLWQVFQTLWTPPRLLIWSWWFLMVYNS